ncbi:MAG: Asp-tRNA(Asn)/Glu-tRNA(Gln) amidotransferase subunit GatC [Candidatus Omnitrophota bacterium]
MKISKDVITYISHLSRLELSNEEEELLRVQLEDILNYFQTLRKLTTDDVEPTSHVVSISNIFRDDALKDSLSPEEALKNAPHRQNNYFKVPRIV